MEGKVATKGKTESGEKTCIKGMGFSGHSVGSHISEVDVKDGKIVRIRPLHYDSKYKPEEFKPWKIEARGKVFEPPMKSLITPFSIGYKKRVYSPNRILYPLKRVDWDPNGERNPQNRGKSKYVRISWDEATDIIVSEIKRIHKEYGPEGILVQGEGHSESKIVHGPHGCSTLLLNLMGGYTQQIRNPDSWEGWYWGAKHVWGCEPEGLASEYQTNLYPDISKNTDMILFQGCDPETTPWGFGGGQMVSRLCYWFTELDIKQVYICPDVNYAAAIHANKWIPILPNTDAAMHLAIAYIWITEGTYDKKYIATHTVGFDKFEAYVLGKEDGIAKTPTWAAGKCGVPSRIIKALARAWATKRTTIAHGLGGPYIRGPYSHEPARLEVVLLAMQGVGKPGANQISMVEIMSFIAAGVLHLTVPPPTPGGVKRLFMIDAVRAYMPFFPPQKQLIPKPMIHDAIIDGHFDIYGSSDQMLPVEDQFKRYVYPVPGCSEAHMIWSDTPCFTTCWNDSNRVHDAYRNPKIETYVVQHPWLENDCLFADLILPVATKFELDDIGTDGIACHFDTLFLERKCIEPIGEAKSDYEIVAMIAEKLGKLEEYTKGKSVQDWIKYGWETSNVADLVSWEQLNEKDYYIVPTDPNWESYPAGMINFYNDPEKYPLSTPTGKIEIYSQRLADHFPDDKERPPMPRWIEGGPGWTHDESLSSERAKKYPLLCQSNHGRWRVHAQLGDVNWFHEIETCKVRGPDGYLYEPVWIHPSEAEKRGIKNGDVVKIYNERGIILAGAYVTERIRPGVAYIDHGARYDPIVLGEFDRGGAINTITPHFGASQNCRGAMVVSGFLVEVAPANLDELRKQYPEAFKRPYHHGSGLMLERVLYGGEQK
jgi:trimethylamine-N-oxide reductase (cytochrome c)